MTCAICRFCLHTSASSPHASVGTSGTNGSGNCLCSTLYRRARVEVDKYREGLPATLATLPACDRLHVWSHPRDYSAPLQPRDKKTSNSLAALGRPSMLNLRFIAGVGVGILAHASCPWPGVRTSLPWALRSSAALALGLAARALATELVFWHRASDCAPKDAAFSSFPVSSLSLFLSALLVAGVTVTSVYSPVCVASRSF